MVDQARSDLGVLETSANSGPKVDKMLREVGVNPPAPWCAAAVSWWMHRASEETGIPAPIAGTAGSLSLRDQLQKAGRWIDVKSIGDARTTLRPGMILVWKRADSTVRGHSALLESVEDGTTLHTIEGNEGAASDGVYRMVRKTTNPLLLGAGWVDDPNAPRPNPAPTPTPNPSPNPSPAPPTNLSAASKVAAVAVGATVGVALALGIFRLQRGR